MLRNHDVLAHVATGGDIDLLAEDPRDAERRLVTELMKQKQYQPLSVAEMALTLFAVNEGFIDEVPVNKIVAFEEGLHAFARGNYKAVLDAINAKPEYSDTNVAEMKKVIEAFKKTGTY